MSDMMLQAIMKLDTDQAQKSLGGLHDKFASTMKKMIGIAAGAFAINKLISSGMNVVEMGAKLSELSTRTGVTVQDLTVLREAFETTGVGADEGTSAIGKMQRALGGISEDGLPTNKTFEKLGLNMEELKKARPEEALNKIGDAISEFGDINERASLACNIFGKTGQTMLQYFDETGAIEKVKKSMGDLPDIMQKNAGLFREISDNLQLIKHKGAGFFAGIMEGLAPAIKKMTDYLDSIDLSGKGRSIGQFFGTVIEAFNQGKLGELIGLSLQVGLGKALQWFFEAFIKLIGIIATGLGRMLKAALTFKDTDEVVKNMTEEAKKSSGMGSEVKTASEKLTELWGGLREAAQKKAEELQTQSNERRVYGDKSLGGTPVLKTGFDIASDRLSKIGGFVGGGGPQLDYSKRTASATERAAKYLHKLANTNTHVSAMQWAD